MVRRRSASWRREETSEALSVCLSLSLCLSVSECTLSLSVSLSLQGEKIRIGTLCETHRNGTERNGTERNGTERNGTEATPCTEKRAIEEEQQDEDEAAGCVLCDDCKTMRPIDEVEVVRNLYKCIGGCKAVAHKRARKLKAMD